MLFYCQGNLEFLKTKALLRDYLKWNKIISWYIQIMFAGHFGGGSYLIPRQCQAVHSTFQQ
jgi:hypothetical protein